MSLNEKNKHRWSKEVTQKSHALELSEGVFSWNDPKKIAQSLGESALKSKSRKAAPYQSAMSMLNFYINRAGKKLNSKQRDILEEAKNELRKLFNRLNEDE